MKNKSFAVIGKPVGHSLSPILQNYWLEKYKINAKYSLLDVEEGEIEKITKKIRDGMINGINVTLPYKQKIIPYIDRLVNDAKFTNSVNTIFLDSSNNLIGENTDVYGFQAGYLKKIDDAENKKVLIIGAGGVSPSVIFALKKSKVKNISIVNRTYEKSIFLKKRFNFLKILEWRSLENELVNFDIIINATSLGLKNSSDFEFKFEKVKQSLIYIDTIYNPLETKTLKFLKENNVKTFNGLEMLIYQGQKSFYLWNKINPEIDDQLVNLLVSKLK